ncbi:MAG: hypothetical protein Q8P44_07080 [Dehalococcoidia bacterium]|nr:hypothetical protein [Dehalococcoidia bacterium]
MVRKRIEKLLSIIFSLFLFTLLVTGIHEQFHFITARAFGIEGYVTFTSWSGGGYFHYPDGATPTFFQDSIIGLAGGIGTALILSGLWYFATRQAKYTTWELDDCLALQILMVHQLVYAPFDAWGRSFAAWGSNIGMLVAFVIAVLVYGKRIFSWLQED